LQMIELEWRSARAAASSLEPQPSSAIASEVSPVTQSTAEKVTRQTALSDLNLTQREREVLRVVADGQSNVQIGEQLHLSPRTIEKYVSSLLRKTDTNNRAELVRFAMDHHLLE